LIWASQYLQSQVRWGRKSKPGENKVYGVALERI
jgi:hypothetical protein